MSTDDIDAVLEEWQGSVDAMRWAPDMPEEAADGNYYRATGYSAATRFQAPPSRHDALAAVRAFQLTYGVATDMSTEFDEQINLGFMGGRSITFRVEHHDGENCPFCVMVRQMSALLDEDPSASERRVLDVFSGYRPTWASAEADVASDIRRLWRGDRSWSGWYGEAARGLYQLVPETSPAYWATEDTDPVRKVVFLAMYGDAPEPPGPVTVRNWRPRPPLRPLSVSEPVWPTFAEMMRG